MIILMLIICLPVPSADNLCKQFGPRPGPKKRWAWSESKLFDTVTQKKLILKKSADDKKAWKIIKEAKS